MGDVVTEAFTVPLPGGFGLARKVRTFLGLREGYVAGVNIDVIGEFEKKLEAFQPSAVVFDSGLFGPLALRARRHGCQVFTQTQNCEYDFYAGEAALRGGLAGELLRAAFLAEGQAIEASDVVFTLSSYDRHRLIHLYVEPKDCRIVNPLLMPLTERLSRFSGRKPRGRGAPVAAFLGSAGQQNRWAAELLTRHWTGEMAKLKVVGHVGQFLRQSFRDQELESRDIALCGFVESLDDLLASSDAMVCPMFLGSGVKIKMIDALANGCPVLASEEALHGYEFAKESGWVRACSLREMERVTTQLGEEPPSLERLRDDTRSEVAKHEATLREVYSRLTTAREARG